QTLRSLRQTDGVDRGDRRETAKGRARVHARVVNPPAGRRAGRGGGSVVTVEAVLGDRRAHALTAAGGGPAAVAGAGQGAGPAVAAATARLRGPHGAH